MFKATGTALNQEKPKTVLFYHRRGHHERQLGFHKIMSNHNNGSKVLFTRYNKGKKWRLPILVTERWARSWSWCTRSQPASHPPGGRLPLLSARPAVTFPAAEHHRPLAGTKLYCLETSRCEQLAQGCYAALAPSRIWTYDLLIASPTLYPLNHRATSDIYSVSQKQYTWTFHHNFGKCRSIFKTQWYLQNQCIIVSPCEVITSACMIIVVDQKCSWPSNV